MKSFFNSWIQSCAYRKELYKKLCSFVHTDFNLKLNSGDNVFNQLKYSKIFFGILLFLPLNGMTATQAVEMSSAHKIPISLSGPINPAKILKVQASGGGRVEVLHVKENQHVSKDQLLLTLNNDTQKRQLKLAEIQIKLAESQIKLAETQIEVTKQEKELEIAFNIHYLISVLEKLTSKEINMVIPGGENKSCLLSAIDDESYHYIIMPMRI